MACATGIAPGRELAALHWAPIASGMPNVGTHHAVIPEARRKVSPVSSCKEGDVDAMARALVELRALLRPSNG